MSGSDDDDDVADLGAVVAVVAAAAAAASLPLVENKGLTTTSPCASSERGIVRLIAFGCRTSGALAGAADASGGGGS